MGKGDKIMRWKDLKIGVKLTCGFGTVLGLLVIVSAISWFGFNDVKHLSRDYAVKMEESEFILEKEVDHLNWMHHIGDLFLKEEMTTLEVETDDHLCGFGKWLYSDKTAQAAAHDPKFAAMLEAIMNSSIRR